MSYSDVIHRIDSFLGPSLTPAPGPGAESNDALANGTFDDWKVSWKKEGAEFGKLTVGLACGCIMAFSSLPMSGLMGISSALGQFTQIALPVALPEYLGKPLYAVGAWAGKHIGYYVGWYAGALAAETYELLDKATSKIFQLAKALFAEVLRKLGYPASRDVPPAPPPSPSAMSLDPDSQVLPVNLDVQLQTIAPEPPGLLEASVQKEPEHKDDEPAPPSPLTSPLGAVATPQDLPAQPDNSSSLQGSSVQEDSKPLEENKDPQTPITIEGACGNDVAPLNILNNSVLSVKV